MGRPSGSDADDAGAEAAHALADVQASKRFTLVRRLGSGGMGVVYEVVDRERGETLALKTLQRMSADDILAFKNEFRFLCGITHGNLVRLGELLRVGERWLFTMELVRGVDFQSYVRVPRGDAPSLTTEPVEPTPSPGALTAATVELPASSSGSGRTIRVASASSTQLDEDRLRASLLQLVEGVCALHDAGIVHRDIKPPNVLVEPGGRVVILDFGLATAQRARRSLRVAGTPQYMAPEQAAGLPPSRAADWYAVGVMLYLALIGQLPFMGDIAYVLKQKRFVDAPAPSDLLPDVPADLDELCVELMRRNPEDRPHGREILRRLGRAQAQPLRRMRAPRRAFVGRRAELRTLHASFDAAREQPAVVLLSGRSGVGKSALVQQFVRQLTRDTAALILHGRCYERESMPFKAVDEVIDDLTHQLHELPAEQQRALLPPGAGLIAQAFPVFRKLLAAAGGPRDTNGTAIGIVDPQQRRSALFARLRALMHALVAYRPVVLIIDDLQWADRDSLALLGELTRPPGAPPIMLLCTLHRPEELAGEPAGEPAPLHGLFACEVRQLEIEPLRLRAARELALAALGELDVAPAQVQTMAAAVARESQGVPFFIELLARHAAAHPGQVLDLDRVLRASLAGLAPLEQRILAVVCVSGRPVEVGVLGRALGCAFSELAQSVDALRSHALVASSGAAGDRLECYHEGVRAVVLAGLGEADRRALHRALAQALTEAGGADDELLAIHWSGAGLWAQAALHAERAAHGAAAAMAFDRASKLYAMVLSLEVPSEARRIELLAHMGQALALAGRGAEAARVFLELAEKVPSPHSQHYRRSALAQLLESGHLEQGLAALQELLHEVGIAYPRSELGTKLGLLWRRARLRLRGLDAAPAQPAPGVDHMTALETAYAASAGLSMSDTLRSAYFQTYGLELALASGDAYRVTRALALEACFVALGGHRTAARADDVLARAAAAAQGMDEPHGHAMLALAYGVNAFMRGNWLVARMQLEHAADVLRHRCMGVTWETTTVQRFLCWSLLYLGEVGELHRILPLYEAEAEARGNIHALRSFAAHLRFADDDSARERRKTLALLQCEDVYLRHQLVFNLAMLDLYEGDGVTAWQRVQRGWRLLSASGDLHVELARIAYRELRARTALAALVDERGRGRGLRRAVLREIRYLTREAADWAHGHAHLLRAGLLVVDDEHAAALESYAAAEEVFARTDMKLLACAARDRRGILLGGAEGHALRSEAQRVLDEQGVVNPERVLALLAPGRWPAYRPAGVRALSEPGRRAGTARTGMFRAQSAGE
jgi:serine/threonine protein kinase